MNEETRAEPTRPEKREGWGVDKKISIATGINLVQLLVVVWYGSAFYTQTNERFTTVDKQRTVQDTQLGTLQAAQLKAQEGQNQILVELAKMSERVNSQNDLIKGIRDDFKTGRK
jgi:hypothetical protein